MLATYPDEAIDALPLLLTDERQRMLATALIGKIMMLESPRGDVASELARRAESLLGIDVASATRAVEGTALDDGEDPHFPPIGLIEPEPPAAEPAPRAVRATPAQRATRAAQPASRNPRRAAASRKPR